MDERHFVSLLEDLLKPNTEKIKAATASLNKTYYTSPAALTALLNILISNPNADLRQLAAVESRKLVKKKHWASLPDSQKTTLRQSLLECTLSEDNARARHSKAWVIATIAEVDIADGDWPELPGILRQLASSSQVKHREVGIYILYTLLEAIPDSFQDNIGHMITLLDKAIQDPESVDVRVNAMLALAELCNVLDTEEDHKSLAAFQATIPHMVVVLQQAITNQEEDHIMQAFEIFNRFVSYEAPILQNHLGDLVRLMTDIMCNKSLDDDVRTQACSWLMQCVKFRRMKMMALKVGEELTVKALQVVVELDDDTGDDDEINPPRSALGLLDIMAQSLPPSQVVVPLLKALGQYVNHSDPNYRKAGILALGMCVEGAPDFISTQLKEILPVVLHLLQDSEAKVRSAALQGVARLSDDLPEDMGKEHSQLIPALISTIDLATASSLQGSSQDIDIIRSACMALDSLIEGLEEEDAAKYLHDLVARLEPFVTIDDHKTRTAAVTALGSIAVASGNAFLPYFQKTMAMFGHYMNNKESEDDLDLRSVVCDAVGKLATAVGAESFRPYFAPLMQSSEEGLHLDNDRLTETSYLIWSSLSKVFGAEFAPYMDGVITNLIQCLNQEEVDEKVILGEEAKDIVGQEVIIAGKKIKVAAAADENDDDDVVEIDGDDDDEDGDWDDLGAVTGVAIQKEIALDVLGDILTNTGDKAIPYLEKCLEVVFPMIEHDYENIRAESISLIWRAYTVLFKLTQADANGKSTWKSGLPLKVPVSNDVQHLGSLAMSATLKIYEEEPDPNTVNQINRNLAAVLKSCGPAILTNTAEHNVPCLKKISEVLLSIIYKKHPSQHDPDDEPSNDPNAESSEDEWVLVDSALDVVTGLACALGTDFAELWQMFEKPIMKFTGSKERFERSASVGTIAECTLHMGNACTPSTSKLMTMFIRRLGDEDTETKSNAAYGTGMLCLKSDDVTTVTSNYPTILSKLEPLLHDSQGARLLDNSAGCVARMIKRHPDRMPLGEVLPSLIKMLPLREDYEENIAVFDMIVALYQQNNSVMQGLTADVMPILQTVLAPPEAQLNDETREKVVQLVHYLNGQQ